MIRALLATLLALALVAAPASARDLEPAERAEIRAALDAYAAAIARGEWEVMAEAIPDEVVAVIGADIGVDAATVREELRRELPAMMAEYPILEHAFGEPVGEGVLADGTRYQVVRTRTLVGVSATGQRVVGEYPTVAFDLDGAWRLVSLDNSDTIAQFRRAFPAFRDVDFPPSRFEEVAN